MSWIAQLNQQSHMVIRDTLPDGVAFDATLILVLQREQHWVCAQYFSGFPLKTHELGRFGGNFRVAKTLSNRLWTLTLLQMKHAKRSDACKPLLENCSGKWATLG